MKRTVLGAIAAAMLTPLAVSGQGTSGPVEPAQVRYYEINNRQGTLVADRVEFVAGAVEARTTTGRPYSAEAVTEITQVLADGNRIERQNVTRIYRDGQGRTRREQIVNGVVRSISISDPVANVSYTLDPEQKIARRSSRLTSSAVAPGGGGERRVLAAGDGWVTRPSAPVVVEGRAVARGGGGGGVGGSEPTAPALAPTRVRGSADNAKREDLGVQTMEGVPARGSRTTTTIPAGTIGNLQDIKIVSEQWFSEDLQVLVMTKHSDPRSGENVYRLRNLVRAEPDASLFTVPSDYNIRQSDVR